MKDPLATIHILTGIRSSSDIWVIGLALFVLLLTVVGFAFLWLVILRPAMGKRDKGDKRQDTPESDTYSDRTKTYVDY